MRDLRALLTSEEASGDISGVGGPATDENEICWHPTAEGDLETDLRGIHMTADEQKESATRGRPVGDHR